MSIGTTLRRHSVILVLVALLVSACGSDRPSVDDWQSRWDRISTSIPSEASLDAAESPAAFCTETLAYLRSNRAELVPTPDPAIDDVVTAWVEIAEDAFFECPPHNDQVGDFAEAYAELNRLAAEIELVLDIDRVE